MSAGATAGAAAAAAAAARQRMEREEEEMTSYSPQDLSEGWEFKIIRSVRGQFRYPDRLQQILAEEARAGWTMVEKFDNARIRLKRRTTCRERDAKLDFDPYRTVVGPSEAKVVLTIVGIVLLVVIAIFLLVALIANAT